MAVLQNLDQLNNLNGVLEFVSALNSVAILRLEQTVAGVSSYVNIYQGKFVSVCYIGDRRQWQQFEALKELASQKDNSKALRERVKTLSPPCIPYLGLYLTDILFIEVYMTYNRCYFSNNNTCTLQEGHKNDVGDGLINFSKRRQVAAVLREILQLQGSPGAVLGFLCLMVT